MQAKKDQEELDRRKKAEKGRDIKRETFLTPKEIPKTLEEYDQFVENEGSLELLVASRVDPEQLRKRLVLERY